MKRTIVLALGLALAGSFSLSASADDAPALAPKPTEVRKKKTKKKPVADPVVDPGTHDGDDTNRLVNCWCSGGADGSGPAQCQADSCDGADSCCVDAYGAGAESSDQ